MKIIIFGSTGTIGYQLLLQGLSLNHSVTAFARNPEKLDIEHPNLRIASGNVLDLDSVYKAVQGHDAVLCALGAGRKGGVRAAGTLNIIRAMEKTGVKRLICQTTLGLDDSKENLNLFWKNVMFGWFLKEAFEDHQQQEKYIKESSLDWTIVRPAAFTDGGVSKNYKHGFSGAEKNLSLKISRADVAMFMLLQLHSKEYLHKTPGISY